MICVFPIFVLLHHVTWGCQCILLLAKVHIIPEASDGLGLPAVRLDLPVLLVDDEEEEAQADGYDHPAPHAPPPSHPLHGALRQRDQPAPRHRRHHVGKEGGRGGGGGGGAGGRREMMMMRMSRLLPHRGWAAAGGGGMTARV